MNKILITGGAGFIASELARKLSKHEDNMITLVDNFLTGRKENIPELKNVKFINCDVNNYKQLSSVMTSHNFDIVFHYAAVVGVKRTIENPVSVMDDLFGIKNVLELSKNTGVKRVFFSSSSEVYGEPVEIPLIENTTPLNARLPYAIVKNSGEAYFKSYYQEYGLEYTIFRFFNTYGLRQSEDFVVSKFIRSALAGDDITIYGDGSQTRTFCYIDDNLDLTEKCLYDNCAVNQTLNVGNDIIYTINDLASIIIDITNSVSRVVYLPPLEAGDMTRRQPDASLMKGILNRSLTPLEDGLKKIIGSIAISNSFR